jgi:tRNA(Ile)-lysidine synthase
VDADALALPLTVRYRRQGDSFHPLGAKGRMKLKKFFIGEKLESSLRETIPLVFDSNDELIWVAGLRISERVRVKKATDRIFILSYE